MQDIMIDLETLGTQPGSTILTIGAIKFTRYGDVESLISGYPKTVEDIEAVTDCFYRRIDMESCQAVGLLADESTVKWWMNQKEDARYEAITAQPRCPIGEALDQFYMWAGGATPWSHGAGFDVTLLERAYIVLGKKAPWRYSAVRDTRTLYDLGNVNLKKFSGSKIHHALFDCWDQIRAAQAAFKGIRGGEQ